MARREVERIDRGLAGIALTDGLMRAIEEAAAAVEMAAAQVELMSARIELVAASDLEILLDGERVALAARCRLVGECQCGQPRSNCPAC